MLPFAWGFQSTAAAQTNIQRLTEQSNFVFRGTVSRLNATTEPQVPASPSTAVVLVDTVIQGDNMVSDVKGKEITVQLLSPRSVSVGRPMLFFSNVAVAGKSLAVKEVAHFDATRSSALLSQASNNAKSKPERDLQAATARAELIVTGSVASIRRPEQPQGPPPSEHDPEWTEAIVTVQSTEKGSAQQRVSVWFPASTDIRWFRSPKFQAGQSGVFLLRRTRDVGLQRFAAGSQGFTALEPLDFQPLTERDHVRRLVTRGR
jgi:hypothetical protein